MRTLTLAMLTMFWTTEFAFSQEVSGTREVSVLFRLGTAVVTKTSGGPVKIPHGLGVVSNRSSLNLDWIVVTDSSLSLVFDSPVGAQGIYDDPWYRYHSNMHVKALAPVAAFEVRMLTFDVWGEFTGTLSFTQLEDLSSGQSKDFDRVWGIYGESQLRSHFTTVAYVARVRLQDGRTIVADPTSALRAAQAIQANITIQDLTPKPEPIPGFSRRT